jgi:selenium-binding protein 1
VPLATRWALKPNASYGYSINHAGNSIWMFRRGKDGVFSYAKAADLSAGCLPGDLRQSADDRYMYVSCIGGGEVQAWDISKPDRIRLHDTVQGLVQANMMHLTLDGKRLYVTNSAISSIDFSPRYALRLIHVGPDGKMKQDPFFAIDFSQAPNGPARPHDMLLN